jgi:hypothetical protein
MCCDQIARRFLKREISMTSIHVDLLAPAGMTEARTAAIDAFSWFTHASTTDQFGSIQKDGLKPKWPKSIPPQEVIDSIGDDGRNIICLSPYPKQTLLFLNKGGKSAFKLALPANKLPVRVGVDWSFGGTWDLTLSIHRHMNGALLRQVFVSVLRDREVIIAYDAIPAADLKVCTEALRDKNPSDWPDLVATDFKHVAIFEPDALGNIAL